MATSTGTSIETILRNQLPLESTSSNVAAYIVDGLTPSIVALPATIEEAATTLRAANEAEAAVIPFGNGSHRSFGMPPRRYDVAVDMTRLNAIIEYQPDDLTVTVQAGLKLGDLQAALAQHGQWLPLDPDGAHSTIGGILAANRSGPARIVSGSARDLVIGLQVLTAEGALIKSGGRVVKNVAGYDLAKLHIGALGTLGIIVQASFKIAPLPVVSSSLAFTGSLHDVMSTATTVRNLGLAVNGIGVTGQGDAWQLTVRFAGGNAAVERSRREIRTLASDRKLVADSGEARLLREGEVLSAVAARITVPTTKVLDLCKALTDTEASIESYPTAGIIHAAWQTAPSNETLRALRTAAVAAGGALVVEAAPVEIKRKFDVWGEPPASFGLMKNLKQQFDPKGTLSPGRFVGGI